MARAVDRTTLLQEARIQKCLDVSGIQVGRTRVEGIAVPPDRIVFQQDHEPNRSRRLLYS